MSNISLSLHFELKEFTASATAREHGIDNTPPPEAVENLRALCVHTLEPLREALGLPVIISSGYRCKALNHLLVCHSNKSQHMEGCAADFNVGQLQVSGSKFQVPGRTDGPGSKFQVSGGGDAPGSKVQVSGGGDAPGSKVQVSGFRHLEHETGASPMEHETPRQRLIRAFRQIITDDSIAFDQCIIYPTFIHVSHVRNGKNRRKLTRGFGNGTYAALTRAQALALN